MLGSRRLVDRSCAKVAFAVGFSLMAAGACPRLRGQELPVEEKPRDTALSHAGSAQDPSLLDLSDLCAAIGREFDFPATAVLAVYRGQTVAHGVAGVRRRGYDEPVTFDDRFHLGSCTKAMTALVVGRLIEEGHKLSWDSTVWQVLGDVIPHIHPDFRNVTLRQLLGHRAGLASQPQALLWMAAWAHPGTPREQRFEFAKQHLIREPAYPPGSKYEYSNTGYTIAGVMLEQATDKPWETLMREQLFEPLGMKSAGFGPPGTAVDHADQPWGHHPQPEPPGKRADNPDAIGPAGKVHCALPEMGRYMIAVLRGLRGDDSLARPETFRQLATPLDGQNYALGWSIQDRPWAKGRTLSHAGSNTMFYMIIWLAPEIDLGIVVATNTGQENAATGLDKLVGQTIQSVIGNREE